MQARDVARAASFGSPPAPRWRRTASFSDGIDVRSPIDGPTGWPSSPTALSATSWCDTATTTTPRSRLSGGLAGSTRGSRKLLRAKRSDGCILRPVSRVHFATGDMLCGPRSPDAQIPPPWHLTPSWSSSYRTDHLDSVRSCRRHALTVSAYSWGARARDRGRRSARAAPIAIALSACGIRTSHNWRGPRSPRPTLTITAASASPACGPRRAPVAVGYLAPCSTRAQQTTRGRPKNRRLTLKRDP